MGMKDKFDNLKGKAKDAMGEHGDKVNEGIDRAKDFADEKTEGKYSEQIDQGAEQARDWTEQQR
ncbi:MAG: antitoxin [Micromonosporaceae bacterium]